MSIVLPDNLFPAVVFLENTPPTLPEIVTIMIYTTNQPYPLYTAWFHNTSNINITVYKDGDKWIEKRYEIETVNSKAIGTAIEMYNPF